MKQDPSSLDILVEPLAAEVLLPILFELSSVDIVHSQME